MMNTRAFFFGLTLFGLIGCSVGPDFVRPAAPQAKQFTATYLPEKTASSSVPGGQAQRFQENTDVPAQWWKLFGSQELDALVEQAFKANPDVQAAKASLKQAQENLYAGYGELLPSIDLVPSVTREKFVGAAYGLPQAPSTIFTLYNASVNVSYGIDIFGAARREIESLKALSEAQRYELEATYLTLSTNVVTTAIAEASLKEQIKQTEDIIKQERELLTIARNQLAFGSITRAAVLEQETALAQTQATLPTLEKQLSVERHRLAILVGDLPAEHANDDFDLSTLHLPENVPVSLPSRLTEQRPDIKEAEANLHAASAEVGVATANMFPRITLTASGGSVSTGFNSLFSPGTSIWSIGAGLTQPIFHGGTLLHQKRATVAAFDKAFAQYKSTVLLAFGNVADTLRALQYDADGLVAQANAEKAASANLNMARVQLQVGAISNAQFLTAQNALAQTRIALVQARALRLSDTVALFQALGGGWWNRSDSNVQEKKS